MKLRYWVLAGVGLTGIAGAATVAYALFVPPAASDPFGALRDSHIVPRACVGKTRCVIDYYDGQYKAMIVDRRVVSRDDQNYVITGHWARRGGKLSTAVTGEINEPFSFSIPKYMWDGKPAPTAVATPR